MQQKQTLILKIATGVDSSDFAKKTDLANLESVADKSDLEQPKNVPSGLNKLKK